RSARHEASSPPLQRSRSSAPSRRGCPSPAKALIRSYLNSRSRKISFIIVDKHDSVSLEAHKAPGKMSGRMTPRSDQSASLPLSAAAAREHWALAPGLAYLNHGGFGLTPRRLLEEQDRWRARIERNPTRFLGSEIETALREAVQPVAAALGAAAADLVFVENATTGLNAVLRALDFEPGDEILITSLSYPAIRKAAYYAASRCGARVVEAKIPLPLPDKAALLRAVAAKLTIRTKLAIFDHIASHSALLLPADELTRLAHEAGARVMIDGAHAPGQIPLDIAALGADWYVGNLHKWYFAPRSCGFLWVSK